MGMKSEPCRHERVVAAADARFNRIFEKTVAERDAALVTIERIRTVVADPHAALVVDRIRVALEATP